MLSLSLLPSVELSLVLQNVSSSALKVVKFDTLAFSLLVLMEPAYRELNSWFGGSLCNLFYILCLVSSDNLMQICESAFFFMLKMTNV